MSENSPIIMSDAEKREALRQHVLGMVQSMNRKQRRAFLSVASKTKDLEKATTAAISCGWVPGSPIKKAIAPVKAL